MVGYLYSYNQGSAGGRALSESLGIRRLRHERSTFRGSPNKTVINWGASELPANINGSPILNKPEDVADVCDKLRFFQKMANGADSPRIPEWTTDHETALNWVGNGNTVCIRTMLRASGARGLIIVNRNNVNEFVRAPLYTKYIPKKDEYRVHVVRGRVIDIQRKALRQDVDREEANWQIRNLENGFIFARNEGREVPADVSVQALKAMAVSGLDFGAVDILYKERDNTAWVLEINTAPGLMNTTLEVYTNALRELI